MGIVVGVGAGLVVLGGAVRVVVVVLMGVCGG